MFELTGKVAVIVGGSTGIGARAAELFCEAGARVVVGDIAVETGEQRCAKIRAAGGDATFVRTDASSPADVEHLMAETADRHGRIDVLFNNAAAVHILTGDLPVAEVDLDNFDQTMAVNLRGVLLGCKYVIPYMLENGSGSIINTASVRAMGGHRENTAYGVSKIGVIGLTRNVATMYGRQGIRCNAIAPGWVITEVTAPHVTEEHYRSIHRQYLTPRVGTPDDIAKCALFLASDDAGYIQGQLIPVDGGVTAHLPYYGDDPA